MSGAIDISPDSRDSRGRIFLPSQGLEQWAMDLERTRKEVPKEEFQERYRLEMRASYQAHRQDWEALLKRPSLILLCRCNRGDWCHRKILARFFEKASRGEATYQDSSLEELPPFHELKRVQMPPIQAPRGALPGTDETFVAIDFEGADGKNDSACALGMVRVEKNRIVSRWSQFFRPPRSEVTLTRIHGLTWHFLSRYKPIAEHFREIEDFIEGASYLVAHNAPYDRRMWLGAYATASKTFRDIPFHCTVQMSREIWPSLAAHSLDALSHLFQIPLKHHEAASDAEACARILLLARRELQEATLIPLAQPVLPMSTTA